MRYRKVAAVLLMLILQIMYIDAKAIPLKLRLSKDVIENNEADNSDTDIPTYDYAFYRKTKANDEYYMFDSTNMIVAHFWKKRNFFFNTPEYGLYSGNLFVEISISYPNKATIFKMKYEDGKLIEFESNAIPQPAYLEIDVSEIEDFLINPR